MLTIVGGGSTGLFTLSAMLKEGSECKVYEATDGIGGILRDVRWQNSHYFSGCQYLSPNNGWFNSLPNQDLLSFNQSYASFTDLFGPESISKEFSGPVYDGSLQPLDTNINFQNSIYDKICGYPSPVKEGLLNWMTSLGISPRTFHALSLKPLGVSRVHFRSHDERVKGWREKDPFLSEYFGIPYVNHGPKMPVAIPNSGFSRYFDDDFYNQYRESIIKKSAIKIKFDSGTFILKSDKTPEIDSEKILWSGNPNPVLRALGIKALDSFNFKCQLICGEIRNWDGDPFYVQVYSKNSKVLRIYLYKLNGVSRFTIERAYGMESIESTCEFVVDILSKLNLQVNLEPKGIWKQSRYNLLTINDYQSLTNLEYFLQDTNLVSGAWQEYDRNSKISKIVASCHR
jgi:hypothetical protein